MRGRGRSIATVLTDALAGSPGAHRTAITAAFAEACGWPLAREVSLRAISHEGCLIAVASTPAWAEQVAALGPAIRAKMNARFGREIATALDVRTGPLGR